MPWDAQALSVACKQAAAWQIHLAAAWWAQLSGEVDVECLSISLALGCAVCIALGVTSGPVSEPGLCAGAVLQPPHRSCCGVSLCNWL